MRLSAYRHCERSEWDARRREAITWLQSSHVVARGLLQSFHHTPLSLLRNDATIHYASYKAIFKQRALFIARRLRRLDLLTSFGDNLAMTVIQRLIILLVGIVAYSNPAFAQYKYGLTPMRFDEYKQSVKLNPQKELIDLEEFIPGIVLDIRYATSDNFTKEKIYNIAKAYARKPVAEALKNVQQELSKQGIGIKLFDGYRPYAATVKFYEVYHDTTFVASPYRGSKHNRGCALDLTLIDLKTGKELKMPTGYDAFVKEARPTYPIRDDEAKKNRELLIDVMRKYGFKVNASEWWHFDFKGWKNFEVLDIAFEELIDR